MRGFAHSSSLPWLVAALVGLFALPAQAQQVAPLQIGATQTGSTQTQGSQQGGADAQTLRLNEVDRAQAQLWGLDDDEMLRVKTLRLGPRGAFSVSGISPLEILGIHARSDAERRKYAEKFARIQYDDVGRVLAFQREFQKEISRLTAGQPMINYANLPKVRATEGGADLMNVPRSMLIEDGAAGGASGQGQP